MHFVGKERGFFLFVHTFQYAADMEIGNVQFFADLLMDFFVNGCFKFRGENKMQVFERQFPDMGKNGMKFVIKPVRGSCIRKIRSVIGAAVR